MSNFDILVKNGTLVTMDESLSWKRWMGIKDGKITALGDKDDYDGCVASKVIDLNGKTVMPGLFETHVHSALTGLGWNGMDFSNAKNSREVLEIVEDFCSKDKTDQMVYGCNMNLPHQMDDKKVPTREELDDVSGNHPVMILFWTVHGGITNTKGCERANLKPEMEFVKKDGYFNDDWVSSHIIAELLGQFSDDVYKDIFMKVAEQYASRGVTTVHSLDGMWVKDDKDSEILINMREELPIEFIPFIQTFDIEKVKKFGLKQIGGCLPIDGSPPQLTAAYWEPYRMKDQSYTRGFLCYTDKELYDFVTACTKESIQCTFHAIGERAIDQLLYIYQQVDREIGIRHLRHRIEHFSMPPHERSYEMIKEMNIPVAMQPAISNMLDTDEFSIFATQVSDEKALIHENAANAVKKGLTVIGGCDGPVTPLDSYWGINAAAHPHKDYRRMSLDDAIKLFTTNAAWACHQEHRLGSLEVGKDADFAIVDKNLYEMPDNADLASIVVYETFKTGKSVFKLEG